MNDELLENSSALEMNVLTSFTYVEDSYERVFGYETNDDIEAEEVENDT